MAEAKMFNKGFLKLSVLLFTSMHMNDFFKINILKLKKRAVKWMREANVLFLLYFHW